MSTNNNGEELVEHESPQKQEPKVEENEAEEEASPMKVTDYDNNFQVEEPVQEKTPFIKGPLMIRNSMNGTFTSKTSPNTMSPKQKRNVGPLSNSQQNVMAKRVQKRLQLKNMIILKFRNKYLCSMENEEELNQFIQDKMDELFAEQVFDERDLIKVDKMIMEKHQEL